MTDPTPTPDVDLDARCQHETWISGHCTRCGVTMERLEESRPAASDLDQLKAALQAGPRHQMSKEGALSLIERVQDAEREAEALRSVALDEREATSRVAVERDEALAARDRLSDAFNKARTDAEHAWAKVAAVWELADKWAHCGDPGDPCRKAARAVHAALADPEADR